MNDRPSRARDIRNRPKPDEPVTPARRPGDQPPPFPPRVDFTSLSLRDLLDARDAYHVHLSHMENVVATAIGRYLIHQDDWFATHGPDEPRPAGVERPAEPRSLTNSIMRSWSWPCVLVFVRRWERSRHLGDSAIPKRLHLPDGRQVPTCVVLGTPDESLPPPVVEPGFASELVGGGYRCERHGQGTVEVGTLGCLVRKEGAYYALTNRHVAGTTGEEVFARIRGERVRIGVSDGTAVTKQTLKGLFPAYGESHAFVNMDAGLVRLDNVGDWTSQVFGIGEIGEVFDATASTLTLDLTGLPVRAFGGTSGVLEGEIKALFFRYQSLGDFDYVSDLLIGPRRPSQRPKPGSPAALRKPAEPKAETRPGDSGTLWFYDPPSGRRPPPTGPVPYPTDPPERPDRARRLRPLAMQWGGQRVALPSGEKNAFALATFVSTVCRVLDVEIVRTWSTGHDEYWGKIGHFAVGWKACDLLGGKLGGLMKGNQSNIGFGNDRLGEGSAFRMGRGDFVPLADVPDYVWIAASNFVDTRKAEASQHFADIDIPSVDGGPSMLELCRDDKRNVDPAVWRDFFAGFAAHDCGPEEGALPFRVWQLWDGMVAALVKKDVKTFVATAGVLAHYVGDASQPLHSSFLHHGRLPLIELPTGRFPVRHGSAPYDAFKKTAAAKIHGIFEQRMLELDTLAALEAIDGRLAHASVTSTGIDNGWEAACAVFDLMSDAQDRLPPETILDADDPTLGPTDRARRLWANSKVRNETIRSLAESTILLARLWASAWRVGKGKNLAASKLKVFTEPEIQAVYKKKTFAPALTLTQMANSGRFVVP
jgi:hypothetical protein